MRTEPAVVFFDMDGTLLDWQAGMEESWVAACANGCPQLPGVALEALLSAVRTKRDWFWAHPEYRHTGRMDLDAATRTIVTEAVRSLGLDLPDVAAAIAGDYRARRDGQIVLYPGAVETVEHFRAGGARTALITNGNAVTQRRSVERFGLDRLFDCVIIEGEFGCGKPDERVFRHALAACRGDAETTWMIGDNLEADIMTPLALGMHTVWVDGDGGGLPDDAPARPHRIVRAVSELIG